MDNEPFAGLPPLTGAQPEPDNDPFAGLPSIAPEGPSATGAFVRGVAKGALPAIGSLPAIGMGAEAGAAAGAAIGGPIAPLTGAVGGVIGGLAGGFLGASAISKAQDWTLKQLPESWQDKLGVSEKAEQADETKHPVASFLGGMIPYAMTMKPGGWTAAPAQEGATALSRIMANPLTAHLFGGGVVGGMELGQEAAEGNVDWRKVSIATGFGVVFNKPNMLGESLIAAGGRPIRAGLGLPEPAEATAELPATVPTPEESTKEFVRSFPDTGPTVAQASDVGVIGPGNTEATFHGAEEVAPDIAAATRETASIEDQIMRPTPPEPADIHGIARRAEPDLFAEWDRLNNQRDTLKDAVETQGVKSDYDLAEAQRPVTELQEQLDALPRQTGRDARVLKVKLREAQAQFDALKASSDEAAASAGEGVVTPELSQAQKHLQDTELALWKMQPDISAAMRRAEESVGGHLDESTPDTSDTAAVAESNETTPDHISAIQDSETQKLISANRPPEEARAQASVIAAHYQTLADLFKGKLGNALDLYRSMAPDIRFKEAGGPQGLANGSLNAAKTAITLFRRANASTFLHETSHKWLAEMVQLAKHPEAPESLKSDLSTVLKELGVSAPEELKQRHEEQFAKWGEQYFMSGTAPSKPLGRVFAMFRQWLSAVYEKAKITGLPINENIRGVFDRLLSTEPERTVIAPEKVRPPGLHNIHETDAAEVDGADQETRDAMADRVKAEAEQHIETLPPEIRNEVETAIAAAEPTGEVTGRAEPGGDVSEGGAEPELVPAGGDGADVASEVGAGGSENAERATGASPASGTAARDDTKRNLSPSAPFPVTETERTDSAGNIRVENLGKDGRPLDKDIAQAIYESADRNDDFRAARGGTVTKGDMLNLSDAMGLDASKITESGLSKVLGGTKDLGARILAARRLVIQSAEIVKDLGSKAAKGSDADVAALAVAITRHDMIQSYLAGVTAEWGRAGNAFHNLASGWKGAADLNQLLKENTGRTLYQVKRMAAAIDNLEDAHGVSELVNKSRKRNFFSGLLEYWVNGLISGIATHTTYMIGNMALLLGKAGPETAIAAGLGSLQKLRGREGEQVRIGEVKAQLKGAVKAIPGALNAAMEGLRTGQTVLLPGEEPGKSMPFQYNTPGAEQAHMAETTNLADLKANLFGNIRGIRDGVRAYGKLMSEGGDASAPTISLLTSPSGAIPDIAFRGQNVLPVGTAIRLPARAIASIHSFYRAMNYSVDKSSLAYRAAADEGLSGDRLNARVGQLWSNPTDEIMDHARGVATELTLMGQGSEFTRALGRLTNTEVFGFPLLKFIDPFVHIAANVIDQSIIQRTPVGLLSPTIRADIAGRNGNVAQDMATARMLAGTALSLLFGGFAAQGMASGSGPSDPGLAATWRLAGNQAHSVRIGDVWYDTHRLGPLGMLMGISADMYDVAHAASQGDMLNAGKTLMHAFTQNILDESFMKGPSDLIRAMEDADRYGDSYIRNWLSSFVPFSVGLSQADRASDPYSRIARTTMDAIKAKIPGESETLFPRRDIWGAPMPNKEALVAKGLTAIYESQMSSDPVNMELLRLGMSVAQPEKSIRNVELTPQEFDDFSRTAGRMTKSRLDTIVTSDAWRNWPDHLRRDIITQVVRESREASRGLMMLQSPGIAKSATELQYDRLKDEPPPKRIKVEDRTQ